MFLPPLVPMAPFDCLIYGVWNIQQLFMRRPNWNLYYDWSGISKILVSSVANNA